jgi:hypothetical protein
MLKLIISEIVNNTYLVPKNMGFCMKLGMYINLNEIVELCKQYSLDGLEIRCDIESDYDKWCLVEGPEALPDRDLNRAVRIAYEKHIIDRHKV